MFIVTIADETPSSVRGEMSTFRPDGAWQFFNALNYKHCAPTGLMMPVIITCFGGIAEYHHQCKYYASGYDYREGQAGEAVVFPQVDRLSYRDERSAA